MRPSSAQKPPKASEEARGKASSRYKRNPKRNTQGNSAGEHSLTQAWGMGKPSMMRLKTLGLLHAYRPDLLKECLVSEKSSIRKYASGGECNLNDIFVRTALSLFRDWREKIHARLAFFIDAVASSEEVLAPVLEGKVREAVAELQQYCSKIKQQIEELGSKGQSYQLQRLQEKYVLLLETTEHVLRLVDCMRSLSGEVEAYLQLKKNSGARDAEVEAGVREIAEKHAAQAADSLNYCACHPDNQLLLRLEFKARTMLAASTQKVKAIFDSIRELQQYEAGFKRQMLFLQNFQDFSHEYLGHVLETLYSKNEEIKAIEKKFQVSKMPEFISLRGRMEDWETNFIKKLRSKALAYFRQALKVFNSTRALHLIRSRGKEYTELKKHLVLLAKVYQESEKESNIAAEYYQFEKKAVTEVIATLSHSVPLLSPSIEEIQLKIEALEGIKQKGTVPPLKLVEKACQVVGAIEKAQSAIWGITNSAYLKLSRIEDIKPEIIEEAVYSDKKSLERFHQLIFLSRNQEQNNQIFKQLRASTAKSEEIDDLLLSYDRLYALHLQFARGGLEAGLAGARQLRDFLKDELISYLFHEEFRGELITGYFPIKQVCLTEEKLREAAGTQHINGACYYRYSPSLVEDVRRAVNEEIKKLEQNKHRAVLNRYIILIYECLLLQLLNIKQIYFLFAAQENNLQPYRAIFHEYVQAYEGCLTKGRREETPFTVITTKIYAICAVLNEENRLVCEYNNSRNTNQYFPSCSYLSEWLTLEFTAEVEETLNKSAVAAKRAQVKLIFGQFIKKMEAQREKLRARSTKAEAKDTYQHITRNIAMLRQFHFSEDYQELLLKLLRYLQFLNVPNSAIFTRNESPVCVMVTASGQEQINRLLFSMLGISHNGQTKPLITPFPFKDQTNSIAPLQLIEEAQPATPAECIKQDEMAQEIVMNEQIVAQMEEELIEDIIESNLPTSSVLKPAATPQKMSNNLPISEPEAKPLFKYFKIQQIQNISQLKNCLYYHNNEYFTLQSKLSLHLLCRALNPKGRSAAITHIKEVLEQVASNDIVRLMKISDSVPDCEHRLIHFQQSLKSNSDIRQELLLLFAYFKIERRVIYEENGNFIESFRKQNHKLCVLHANLVENCYKRDLKAFEIDRIVDSIWSGIRAGLDSNRPSVFIEVGRSIDNCNRLLMAYYQDIQQNLNKFSQIHTNRKDIEVQVDKFLQQIFNKRRVIDAFKGAGLKDLLASLTLLQENLREVSVIQPYYTFRLDNLVLYIDSVQITQKAITNSLLLPSFGEQFSKCIVYSNDGSPSTQTAIIRTFLTSKSEINHLDFGLIETFLVSLDQQRLQQQIRKIDEKVSSLQSFRSYAKMFDAELDGLLTAAEAVADGSRAIISDLLEVDLKSVRRVEESRSSRQIRMLDGSSRINQLTYYQSPFLDKLASQLSVNNVKFHLVQYHHKTIALLKDYRLLTVAEKLAISTDKIVHLEKQITSSGNQHILKSLYVTFCRLIPSFDNYDPAVQQKIVSYLNEATLEVKQGSKTITLGYEAILQQGNCAQVEAEWPKESIVLTFISPRSTTSLTILPIHYYYFAEIEPIGLRDHVAADYEYIKQKHLADLKQAEQDTLREEIRRQEKLSQLQRIQHERELQKLRMEQERARLRFGTDELHRKNREREAVEKAKLKFIEETTLQKLKQNDEQQKKGHQQSLSDKINHISEVSAIINLNDDFLEFELSLSEGQDERFEEERHCQQYDVEYDYRLTLYQHIRQTYHSLRKKEIDVESWLPRF